MQTVGVIPARLQSSRLPRKMLLRQTGKPLIQHTWESVCQSERLSEVVIATDSEEIAECCESFGAKVCVTGEHPSGTDRIAEVVQREFAAAGLVLNIQGDEPDLDAKYIDGLVAAMQDRPDLEMGTLATPIDSAATLLDTNCVKVVCAADGTALYFSRAPIPFYRDGDPHDLLSPPEETAAYSQSPWLLHVGIYAYRPAFLEAFTRMPASRLEQMERLEQLRALEAGASVLVKIVPHRCVGIDTAADYAAFVQRHEDRSSVD